MLCFAEDAVDHDFNKEKVGMDSVEFSLEVPMSRYTPIICHYIPPQFPVPAKIDRRTIDSCKRSWMAIVTADDIHGIAATTHFYNIFYERLARKASAFKDVFPGGVNGIVMKGKLLLKAMNRMVNINIEDCVQNFEELGRFHNTLDIRLWMFADYFICLIETLNEVLGEKGALYDTMEEWYRLCGFCCFHLIEGASKNKNQKGEIGVANYTGKYTGSERSKVNKVVAKKKEVPKVA